MLWPAGEMDKGGKVRTSCQRQMLQWLLCLLTAFSGIGVCVEQPVNTTFILVTDTKTWSEAQMVCEMMGGYLASPDTTHKMTVFLHFLQLWRSSTWFLALSNAVMIGMHNVDDMNSDPYYWPRNCSLAPRPTSLSYIISQNGGCITMTDSSYTSIACNSQQGFVCEVSRDSCSYETKMNTSVSANVPYTLVRGTNVTWCKAACDAQGIDCWAVAHSPLPGDCYMYNVTSPFFFDDSSKLINNPQFNFHIKRCYEALRNTEPINWMQYDAQPLASPCSLNQSGRVYTLVTLSHTAEQAGAHCHAMGHELAGPAVVSDRNLLQSIINDLYQDTYFVNQTYPLWVNFTGGPSMKSVWRNGTVVTASVTVLGSNPGQCGLLDLDSGTHYLDDCNHPHAFICMTRRPCSYIRQANVFIKGFTSSLWTITSESGCRSSCTQQRARGSACSAYSFKLLTCYFYSASTPDLLSSLTSDLTSQFYWWTCAYVILQANNLRAPTTTTTMTTEPVTTPLRTQDTTTSTSKTSFLTTEAPSVSVTTYSYTVGRTTTTPTISTTQKTPEMVTTSTTTSTKTTTVIREGQITTATTKDTSATNASNQSPTGKSVLPLQLSQATTSTQTAGYATATPTMQPLQKTFNPTASYTTTTPTEATSLTKQKPQEMISTPTLTVVTTETTKGQVTPTATAVASASIVSQSNLGGTSLAPETTEPVTSDFHPETEVNVTSINTTIAVEARKPWMCSCRCISHSVHTPDAQAITQSLMVQSNATYKSRLRYISVDDNRPSCRSIGAVAIVFMCLVAAVIVSSDCVARSK